MGRQKKIKSVFKSEKFGDLVSKLEDLTKISDVIKFKIDKEDLLIYSLVGDNNVHAFKTYKLKTEDYITFKDDLNSVTIDYIVDGAKKFVKNLKFFNLKNSIKSDFTYKGDIEEDTVLYIRNLSFNDSRFKFSYIGSEKNKLRDISKEALDIILDSDNVNWSFSLTNEDFVDIKKLSSINADDKIISFSVDDNMDLKVGEKNWNLKVGEVNEIYDKIVFPKKYLNSISNEVKGDLNFFIYPSFILFNDNDVNLMVSFEQSFDDED